MPALEGQGDKTIIRVRVQPKASREAIIVTPEGAIRVALTAPPVEGKANKALLTCMARALGVPRRAIRLTQGEKSRDKVLCVANVPPDAVSERIHAARVG